VSKFDTKQQPESKCLWESESEPAEIGITNHPGVGLDVHVGGSEHTEFIGGHSGSPDETAGGSSMLVTGALAGIAIGCFAIGAIIVAIC
jgi:hypothetical protein